MAGRENYQEPRWWKEAIVYQIYPSSFQSHAGNKSGWGSVKGITSRLDYLKDLGIDTLWSSPICKSPQVDMGYDIEDYKDIDPCYGTLEDVDELIAQLHKRDMRLIVDIVVNHTSDGHPWFRDSRRSKTSAKRDWYIWRPPKYINDDGIPEPPNNWAQILGEGNSAWNYDVETGEFYLALFTPEQPDLNWENPDVRAAVWDVLDPGHKYQPGFRYFVNGPKLHDYLREMNREVLAKYDTMTVGEMPGVKDETEILRAVGSKAESLNMIFIFEWVDIDSSHVRMSLKEWTVRDLKRILTRWQRTMIDNDGWNAIFFENHDNPRSVSRYTDDSDEWREKGAKLLALMQTTLGGTLFVYQGQEIGMRNAPKTWPIDEFKDIETINYWRKMQSLYPGKQAEARRVIDAKARDHSRTPMQWSSAPNAGFCDEDVTPWMRVMDDYAAVNVEAQRGARSEEELSTWQFWQRGLRDRLRHREVFVYGDFEELAPDHASIYAYYRMSEDAEKWLVVLNFSGEEQAWDLPRDADVEFWACGTYVKGRPDKPLSGGLRLKPWEGVLGKMKAPSCR
ncbi:glycoside hydrolase superfamily [Stachybotrys elegans]|uniref:Glycoside hydrolase superfamily n=1 Tax=Stachybotrys elegans TaxID=80388 RepID=A0A8K0SK08_9HYPO|nr:glycoside hydrolase superfamily [Stachybotrys elegans]